MDLIGKVVWRFWMPGQVLRSGTADGVVVVAMNCDERGANAELSIAGGSAISMENLALGALLALGRRLGESREGRQVLQGFVNDLIARGENGD